MDRVTFSNQTQEIPIIIEGHNINKRAVLDYKQKIRDLITKDPDHSDIPPRFVGLTLNEVESYFNQLILELENQTSFSMISSIEAKLRKDYLLRVYNRKKDMLSKEFQGIYLKKEDRARLEDDILDSWKRYHEDELKSSISRYKGSLNHRDWLAHGRYWSPKYGKYSLSTVYDICNDLITKMEKHLFA
jgi:hypothetical protein